MKEYTIVRYHRGRTQEYTGTLEHLVDVFKYTLTCGASWSSCSGCRKVNTNPKSVKSLVTALNNAVGNTQGSCYERDSYELKI